MPHWQCKRFHHSDCTRIEDATVSLADVTLYLKVVTVVIHICLRDRTASTGLRAVRD
jgi:hypothetical protein